MTRAILVITILVLATATAAHAQQPAAPAGMPMMEMCRTMMASHGGGMMGGQDMMGGGMMMGDPKMMAPMMEMRGEMMKAMGDIMLKHARQLREQAPPATK
jgi:hypothetical protein